MVFVFIDRIEFYSMFDKLIKIFLIKKNDFSLMGLSAFLTDHWLPEKSYKIWEMAAARGLVLSRPVTFVTGNAKKLEEVRAILGNSIPFQSLKLDCNNNNHASLPTFFFKIIFPFLCCFFFSFYLFIICVCDCYYFLFSYFSCLILSFPFILFQVPELQGEPEDISKEKARMAAVQVLCYHFFSHLLNLVGFMLFFLFFSLL